MGMKSLSTMISIVFLHPPLLANLLNSAYVQPHKNIFWYSDKSIKQIETYNI